MSACFCRRVNAKGELIMCFRPADADGAVGPTKCPACGRMVFPMEGILPSKCPFCKTDFSDAMADVAPTSSGNVSAPGAPRGPKPPSAPGL